MTSSYYGPGRKDEHVDGNKQNYVGLDVISVLNTNVPDSVSTARQRSPPGLNQFTGNFDKRNMSFITYLNYVSMTGGGRYLRPWHNGLASFNSTVN